MDAAEACRLGLVQEVVAADQLLDSALRRAAAIAGMPRMAFALQKRLFLDLLLTGAGEAVVEISRHGTPLLLAEVDTKRALERPRRV